LSPRYLSTKSKSPRIILAIHINTPFDAPIRHR
jgi:hypothetical protein